MPSPAATAFIDTLARARKFAALAQDRRLRPLAREDSRIYLHAALASHVAAWESYVERLITNFFDETFDAQVPRFLAVHSLLRTLGTNAADKFNTPHWENTRTLLSNYTGYDPINDWIWTRRNMQGPQVRSRLNEILKVRHSFAHDFTMPSYQWNTSPTGQVRLTTAIIAETEAFFVNLVQRTDNGMRNHIRSNYNAALNW
jgi:hypothetical protein